MVFKTQATSNTFTASDEKKTVVIYSNRLLKLGIEKEDISIRSSARDFTIEIKHSKKYSLLVDGIKACLITEAHFAFWETYSQSEAGQCLRNAYGGQDKFRHFLALFDTTSFNTTISNHNACLFGYAKTENIPAVNAIIDSLQHLQLLPFDIRFKWKTKSLKEKEGLAEYVVLKAAINGEGRMDKPTILEAKVATNKYNSSVEILIQMDSSATVEWAKMTKANINRTIAMVYDDEVFAYPTVMSEITEGRSNITGVFTKEEAQQMVYYLTDQPLPSAMKFQY